jgi:hypothetical protein
LSPAWLLAPAFALLFALLGYAFWPHRRRNFLAVLVLCIVAVVFGQFWQYLELPSLRLGEANVLPAALFAAALQPLADRVPDGSWRRDRKL